MRRPHRVIFSSPSDSRLSQHRRQSRLGLRRCLPLGGRCWWSGCHRDVRLWGQFLRGRDRCWCGSGRAADRSCGLRRHRLSPRSIAERLDPVRNVRGLMVMDRRVAVVPAAVVSTMRITHMPLRRHRRLRQPIRSRLPIRNLLVGVAELRRVGRRIHLRIGAILTGRRRAGAVPLFGVIAVVGHSATHDRHFDWRVPSIVRRQDVVAGTNRPLHDRLQAAIVATCPTVARTRRTLLRTRRTGLLRTCRTRIVRTTARSRRQCQPAQPGQTQSLEKNSAHDNSLFVGDVPTDH